MRLTKVRTESHCCINRLLRQLKMARLFEGEIAVGSGECAIGQRKAGIPTRGLFEKLNLCGQAFLVTRWIVIDQNGSRPVVKLVGLKINRWLLADRCLLLWR